MSFSLEYLGDSIKEGIKYVPVTMKLVAIVFILSIVIGLIVATVRFYRIPVLSQILAVFVTIYMGLPVMVALMLYYMIYLMCFNDIASFFRLSVTIADSSPMLVAYIALTLATACRMSEIFRGAYKAIEQVQFEAGYSIGMTRFQTLRRIIFPQMIPVVISNLINNLVGLTKNANAIAVIGVMEVMNGAIGPCMYTYSYLEGYVAAAIIYWVINIILEQAGKFIGKRSSRYRRQAI